MIQKRYIVHMDMDAFFASVEQRDNIKLKGKPVIIGADPKKGTGRGVVSTCSYEAREFGIHSAMPISIAYKKCSSAVFLPVKMAKYKKVSKQIYQILYNFTPNVEMVSIDEAFLDITESYHLFETAFNTCRKIKEQIRKQIGLTASIGLAPNKMVAKIASDLDKPNGMIKVTSEELFDFLRPLDIEKIWGLGTKNKKILNDAGIKTIGDLAKMDLKKIIRLSGKNGICFWQLAHGIDNRKVKSKDKIKSMSKEHTFQKDVSDYNKVESILMKLSESISYRLNKRKLKGKTITLKIRMKDFSTYNRSFTLENYTSSVEKIYRESKKLYNKLRLKGKIRLVGIKISNLSKDVQYTLFNKDKNGEIKHDKLQKVVNDLKREYGLDSIHFATAQKNNRNARS